MPVNINDAFAKIGAVLGIVETIVAIVSDVKRSLQFAAQETTPYNIETRVDIIYSLLTDPVIGNAALQAQLATFQATTGVDFTAVLTALGSPAQAGTPVTIDGGSVTAVTTDIWAANDLGHGWSTRGQLLDFLGGYLYLGIWGSGIPVFSDSYFIASPSNLPPANSLTTTSIPTAEPANILAGDDLVTWLVRENPGWTVGLGFDNTHYNLQFGISPDWFFQCLIDGEQFERLQAANLGATSALAPVWPGLGNVTLGAPVALSDGLVVTGPMQGLIIEIDTVAYPTSFYPFGTVKSYARAGAVIFTADNDASEFPQPFGPELQVILPKSMTEADTATVRLTSGVTGFATPFTIP